MGETIGPPPLIAPVRPFASGLAANNPPPPILAPLSHGRGIDAPSGLIVGIARPVVAPDGPALPRPAQRAAIGGTRPSMEPTAAEVSADVSSSAVAASPGDVTVRPILAPAGPGPTGSSRGRLQVANPLIRQTMTRAPEPSDRAPIVGLVGQPRASGARQPALSLAATPTVQRAPATIASSPAAPSPTALIPADPLPIAPRLSIGQARRLGLGAPIASVPHGRATQPNDVSGRLTSEPAMPVVTNRPELPSDTIGERDERPDRVELPLAAPPTVAPTSGQAAPPTESASRAVTGPYPLATSARTAAPAARTGAPASPILSARSLRAAVQRAPLTVPPSAAASTGSAVDGPRTGAATGGAPVRVHRGGDAADLSAALDARSFTHGGEIYLPASVGPLTSGQGRSLLAHEMTHVAQQRRLASRLPGEDSPQGRSLEAEAVAAERATDLTLATRPNARPPDDAPLEAIQTVSFPSPADRTSGPQAHAQRAPAGETAGVRSQGPGGWSSDHAHSEQELEALAHLLYQRIGRHLRRELLVDRERAGLALDLP